MALRIGIVRLCIVFRLILGVCSQKRESMSVFSRYKAGNSKGFVH